jgi:hypothetical protein
MVGTWSQHCSCITKESLEYNSAWSIKTTAAVKVFDRGCIDLQKFIKRTKLSDENGK